MPARAFCPGHITGMFTIEDRAAKPLRRGSRGAGFCIGLGATATVETSRGSGTLDITINGLEGEATVTRDAVDLLLPDRSGLDISVEIDLDAPVGQGMGMSAAGTLAACLALAVESGIPDPKYAALKAAHTAEVKNRTGLGDAVAQSIGGFVHRLEPGIPPHGEAERLGAPDTEIIICILGESLSTRKILADPDARKRITEAGTICLADFEKNADFDNFTSLSWVFARDAGLATDAMKEAISAVGGKGAGSMVMLGNALFAWGEADELESALGAHGRVLRTGIEGTGAHIIDWGTARPSIRKA